MVKGKGERELSMTERALTMAIGIIVERVSQLPDEDRQELYSLVRCFSKTQDQDEQDAMVGAMQEILDQEPAGVLAMDPGLPSQRPAKLQRWVDFVASTLKARRTKAGLTQADLAKKSGLPQSHISRIEGAKLSPSRRTVERLAEALGRPVSDFDPSA
jgi:ribosome-binding protein aMBF1 (putative translation factor)